MDAVKFLEELIRLCDSLGCDAGCPLYDKSGDQCLIEIPEYMKGADVGKIISYVEQWSAEHPVKTRLMDFLEKFPNASLGSSGTPLYLPRPFGYCGRETCQGCDHWGSSDCWILPVEE